MTKGANRTSRGLRPALHAFAELGRRVSRYPLLLKFVSCKLRPLRCRVSALPPIADFSRPNILAADLVELGTASIDANGAPSEIVAPMGSWRKLGISGE